MLPLVGRVVVVTGASRGVGRGIALGLGEAGATVYITGRSVRGDQAGGGVAGNIPTSPLNFDRTASLPSRSTLDWYVLSESCSLLNIST